MKFTFLHWLVVGLLVVVIYLILSRPNRANSPQLELALDSIERITQQNQILAMQGKTLETRLAQTSIKFRDDSIAFKSKISALEKTSAQKREKVITIIQDNPDLSDFVVSADNVIATLKQRVDTLEANLKFQKQLYNNLIIIQGKEWVNMNKIVAQKDVIIKDQEKTIRKRNRGNKALKTLAIIGTIGGIIGGSQL